MFTVDSRNSGLHVQQFSPDGDRQGSTHVESHLTKPIHPSIALLPDGKWLVAFGSNRGLVATVLRKDQILFNAQPKAPATNRPPQSAGDRHTNGGKSQ